MSTVRVYIENMTNFHNRIMVCGLADSGSVARIVIEALGSKLGIPIARSQSERI